MANETAGFFQVNKDDWDYLNFILREVQGRLDALGGNSGTFTHQANVNVGSNRVVSIADPVDAQDAVTKQYLETNFVAKPKTDTSTTNTELEKLGLPVVNVGRGFGETAMDIANEPVNGALLGANNSARGAWKWNNPHEIHTFVSNVF